MTSRTKSRLPAILGVIAVAIGLSAAAAIATHPRPRGASPLRASLVPAYKECSVPNSQHGAPLAFPSCKPPVQASNYLTVGTPDANGAAAKFVGFVEIDVSAPSFENELKLSGSISDVRCRPGTAASVCTSANTADGPDYSGTLDMRGTMRVTDHYNGTNLNEAATVQDFPFVATLNCANTADTTIGGLCTVPAPARGPPNCSIRGRRTVAEIGQIEVFDGGPDGDVTTADNTTFVRQGVFVP
jgi:hypothetical protein